MIVSALSSVYLSRAQPQIGPRVAARTRIDTPIGARPQRSSQLNPLYVASQQPGQFHLHEMRRVGTIHSIVDHKSVPRTNSIKHSDGKKSFRRQKSANFRGLVGRAALYQPQANHLSAEPAHKTAADVRAPKNLAAALDGSLAVSNNDLDAAIQAKNLGASSKQPQDTSATIQHMVTATKTATCRLMYEMTRTAPQLKYMAYLSIVVEFISLATYAVPAQPGLHWSTTGGIGGAIADGLDLANFCT